MTRDDLLALAPLLVTALTAVAAMITIAIRRNHLATAMVTGLGLLLALLAVLPAAHRAPRAVTTLVVVDSFGLTFSIIALVAAIAVVVLAHGYLARLSVQREELYVLLATATTGALVLAHAEHFASLFLGLETLSVSLFVMIGYLARLPTAIEAGLKYLVLASLSSAILLFGLALLFTDTGAMQFSELTRALRAGSTALTTAGAALVLVGLGFKLALVPFHLWAADVYQGATAPVTAFVATVSKVGSVAALVRFVAALGPVHGPRVGTVLAVIAGASMIAGNLLALRQENVKRLLAYSSIGQLGYVLVAFIAGGQGGLQAGTFYVAAYVVTLLGAFGSLAALSGEDGEPQTLADLRGLFWRRPLVASVLSASMLSLAGIPLTAGFVAKFYVLAAGANAERWALLVILVLTSGIAVYYYLRVVLALVAAPVRGTVDARVAVPLGASVILALVTVALVWLGVMPGAFGALVRLASGGV